MVMFCWLPCQGSCEFSVHQWNILDLSTQQEDRWILMRRFIQSPLAMLGCAKLLQSCPTLCKGMDRNLSDSSPHGILQTRILDWVTVPSSRASSWPRDRTCLPYVSCIGRQVLSQSPGKPSCCAGWQIQPKYKRFTSSSLLGKIEIKIQCQCQYNISE